MTMNEHDQVDTVMGPISVTRHDHSVGPEIPPPGTEECDAAVNIKGEHFQCDQAPPHTGWAHSNREGQIVWQ